MKIVCVYHSVDLDGWMSAAIVKHWFSTFTEGKWYKTSNNGNLKAFGIVGNTLDFIGYNYGQPVPDLSKYDKVIMCDISFPKEVMLRFFDRLDTNFIWIDHHISAITDIIGADYNYLDNVDESTLLNGLRDRVYAACELTWDFFFPDNDKPEIVRLLGLYDSFRHKGTDEEQKVLEFQYASRTKITNYEEAYDWLMQWTIGHTQSWIQTGKSIYSYLCTEAKQAYKNGFKIEFKINKPIEKGTLINPIIEYTNYKFICINKERFNPINFGIDYHKEGYDGAACFHYANALWHFSLYNDNGLVDCSAIAKQFGGGGHRGASGFRLSTEDFNFLLKLNKK